MCHLNTICGNDSRHFSTWENHAANFSTDSPCELYTESHSPLPARVGSWGDLPHSVAGGVSLIFPSGLRSSHWHKAFFRATLISLLLGWNCDLAISILPNRNF